MPRSQQPKAGPAVQTATDQIVTALYREGIAGLAGALPRAWGQDAIVDFVGIYAEASALPGGTVSRGPRREYLAVHPERLRGFVDVLVHPSVREICTAVLGPHYQVVEVAFDVPFPGAENQRWHRDFPMPDDARDGRLSSLAFNLTTVDVRPDMGPFEVAPGTHFDDGSAWLHGMFPATTERFEARRQQRCPQLGDMSVRTGLTVHRGTANRSDAARPILIVGVVASDVHTADVHEITVTRGYYDALPDEVRAHLRCRVVDQLEPIIQKHTIEGLMMGGGT